MDYSMASSSGLEAENPRRRVLPSRSRRGGPGVGNCDADIMILETQKRKSENDPLIPPETRFLLTTSLSLAPPEAPTSSNLVINSRGYDHYFDRPEVMKAYREQMIIETPEFTTITEAHHVGGRFRPRGSEDVADTSDEAYERRHRRYEKLEKRTRLRELEKLHHEQYKLRERVEQLRSLDYTAFLALPASSFPPVSPREDNNEHGASTSATHANSSAVAEGERRRRVMLEIAESLEDRYKVLLPPDWRKKGNGNATPATTDAEAPLDERHSTIRVLSRPAKISAEEGESENDDKEEGEDVTKPARESLKLKIKIGSMKSQTPDESTVKRVRGPSKKKKQSLSDAVQVPSLTQPPSSISGGTARFISAKHSLGTKSAHSPISNPEIAVLEQGAVADQISIDGRSTPAQPDQPVVPTRKRGRPRRDQTRSVNANGRGVGHLPNSEEPAASVTPLDELATPEPSLSRPRKRAKGTTASHSHDDFATHSKDYSLPPIETGAESVSAAVGRRSVSQVPGRAVSSVSRAERNRGILVTTALHYESAPNPRKRHRHHLAWGFKLPTEVTDLEMNYEMPLWLLHDDEFQARYSKYPEQPAGDRRGDQMMNPDFVRNPRFVNGVRMPSPERDELETELIPANREHGEDSQSELDEDEKEEEEVEEEEKEDGEEEIVRDSPEPEEET